MESCLQTLDFLDENGDFKFDENFDLDGLLLRRVDLNSVSLNLKSRIFGQDNIIDEIIDTLFIYQAGLRAAFKPVASFLFVGATGTGKTEIAKELAKELKMEFLRIDMSEYANEYSLQNFIGGSKGLVGYDDGGILTNAIDDRPNTLILFDEIEKAHKRVYNIFLQILDYGKLTDTKGNSVDFTNTIIIFTSNLGFGNSADSDEDEHSKKSIGFVSSNSSANDYQNTDIESIVLAVNDNFKPEFRARLDKTLFFNTIEKTTASKIVDKFLNELTIKLKSKNIALKISNSAKQLLVKEYMKDCTEGARVISKLIDYNFKNDIAKIIIENRKLKRAGSVVNIDTKDESFTLTQAPLCFESFDEAMEYAKKHKGTIVVRLNDKDSWGIKENNEDNYTINENEYEAIAKDLEQEQEQILVCNWQNDL
jgi:ATP-dependent Clp protease ATP-binding subunit ClpB